MKHWRIPIKSVTDHFQAAKGAGYMAARAGLFGLLAFAKLNNIKVDGTRTELQPLRRGDFVLHE